MQEVDLWQAGELDYRKIRGGTGPLVYPAGFLYVYGYLKSLTDNGTNVYQAQVYFVFLHVINAAIVLTIYIQVARRMVTQQRHFHNNDMQQANMVWSWRIAMAYTCLSKRIHSIFVLRLFNDAPAMLLLYASVLLFLKSKWRLGSVVFSLAVSIKMNILLFAPGLLLLLLQFPADIWETITCLGICALIQVLLGAPFLLSYPESYIRKAFEFDRVFFYKWTVNWKVRRDNMVCVWYCSCTHSVRVVYSFCRNTSLSPSHCPSCCSYCTCRFSPCWPDSGYSLPNNKLVDISFSINVSLPNMSSIQWQCLIMWESSLLGHCTINFTFGTFTLCPC